MTLFVGSVPKTANEDALREIFEPYGTIELISVLRDKMTHESKSCAFVRFSDRVACINAIEALNGSCMMEVIVATLHILESS